jgi:hypothetical protein
LEQHEKIGKYFKNLKFLNFKKKWNTAGAGFFLITNFET